VFESWFLNLLLSWHSQDPVSQKEIDRNEAAFSFQNNRNPFVDHPELVNNIWGN
ncbi:MAG: endonuclease, partial [Pseudomonadota bacterium]|nr:endonuclease [Pseudomonadota bacterium]